MSITTVTRDVHELTDPRAIPGLVGWYDARYPNGIGSALPFDGDPIATWTDLSGTGNHVSQASVSLRPVWRSMERNYAPYFKSHRWAIHPVHVIEAPNQLSLTYTGDDIAQPGLELSEVRIPVPQDLPGGVPTSMRVDCELAALGTSTQGYVQRYFGTSYISADGVTTAPNTNGHFGNGSAADQSNVTNPDGVTFYPDVGWNPPIGNPDIKYVDFRMCYYNGQQGLKVRNLMIKWRRQDGQYTEPTNAYVKPAVPAGGQPVVVFDGIDDYLLKSNHNHANNDTTVYTVHYYDDITNSFSRVTRKNHATVNGAYGWGLAPSVSTAKSRFFAYSTNVGSVVIGQANNELPPYGKPMITSSTLEQRPDPVTTVSHWNNGKLHSAGSLSLVGEYIPATNGRLFIGADAGSYWMKGGISCVLIYEGVHNTETRKKIERMLSRTFGTPLEA